MIEEIAIAFLSGGIGAIVASILCGDAAGEMQQLADDLARRLRRLARAESDYRTAADQLGDDHPVTQRAMDVMRRAGDAAREADYALTGARR